MCKGQCGFGFGFYYLRYGQFGPWAVSGRFLVIFGSVHSVWTAGTSCLTLVKLPGNASAFAFFTVPRKQFQISYSKWFYVEIQPALLFFIAQRKQFQVSKWFYRDEGGTVQQFSLGSGSCGSRFLRFEGYLILDGLIRQFHFGSRTLLKVSACQHYELSRWWLCQSACASA